LTVRPLAVLFGALLLASPLLPLLDSPVRVVQAGSLPTWNRTFHLHDGSVQAGGLYDWMNSTGPYNPAWTDYDFDSLPGITIKKNVPPQRYHEWLLYPALDSPMDLSGTINVHVWAKSQGNDSGTIVSAQFYDVTSGQFSSPLSGTLICQGTSNLAGPYYSEFQMVNISIPSVAYTLPQGHYLSLIIQRGDSLNDWLLVWYDTTIYDSYITLTTSQFISVMETHPEDSEGAVRTDYNEFENVTISANVTDPFGAYDILGAYVNVSYAVNGTQIASMIPMTTVLTDTSAIPYWEVMKVTLPRYGNGSYVANVTARDTNGYPCWLATAFTVVSVDHFNVSAPSRITAWSPFQVSVTAQNSTNGTVTAWVGSVQLEVFKADKVTTGSGSLSTTRAWINSSDNGTVTLANLTYSFGEESIYIRAMNGTGTGWSSLITVSSGPVVNISISPGDTMMHAGKVAVFTASGIDSHNNTNTSWTPYWNVSGTIGNVSSAGLQAAFEATSIGLGMLFCANNATGASANVTINVTAGSLARINISSPTYPLVVHENESVNLTAIGYDLRGNLVDVPTYANWTTTAGTISGSGATAIVFGGMIPETGVVRVIADGIVASLNVTVRESWTGPRLGNIPGQLQYEDAGKWTLDLNQNSYWSWNGSSSDLFWWVENVNTSLYFITHDPDHNSIMDFYTQPNQNGEDVFTLWVISPEGFRTFQNVTVTIIAVNDPPRFVNNVATELWVKFDMPYTFDYTYYVSDVDNDKTQLMLSSNAPQYSPSAIWNISFDGLEATFLFKHQGTMKSYFEIVTLTVTDPGGLSDSKVIVVTASDDTPPVLNQTLPDQTIYEGTINQWAFNLNDFFYDPDNEPLYYTSGFENIPAPFINQTTHDVYFSAPGEWSGVTYGTFVAKDATGAIKVDTISVTVIAVNDPPVVTNITDVIQVKHDLPYYVYLSSIVKDPDNTLDSLNIQVSDPNVTIGFSDTGAKRLQILYPASALGLTMTVWITATDPEGLSGSGYFKVLVTDNIPPSVVIPKPDQLYVSFPENEYAVDIMMLYSVFNDSDDASLNFTIVSNGTRVHYDIASNGAMSLWADDNWSGSELYTITATDAQGAWASVQLTIVVTPVNQPPVAVLLKSKLISVGGPRTLVFDLASFVLFYDSDNDVLTIIVTPEANAAVVGDKLYVTLPQGVDKITVTLVADDGTFKSNPVSVEVGVEKTIAQKIGYPYTFPLVLMVAGIIGYFLGGRIPRPYSLENLFLIHNDGRLIAHVTREENTNLDKDVVSAMFTAVQEFVRDSFQKGEEGLKKLEIGDKNVLIEKGKSAYLALIYSGWPQKETFQMLPMLLGDIEERYKDRLEHWNGTAKAVKGVEKMLQDYMAHAFKPGTWQEEEAIAEEEWVDILNKES
jgi:hypothetical protein